ncbi:MAG: hypothetical protein FWC34_07595 [Bacteroidetes bacterium]|nr:hypothetical protein [Bacteroidota bacterium]MCL2303152.1 hypothetical protein [Lentimicrobiaceae bacterium]
MSRISLTFFYIFSLLLCLSLVISCKKPIVDSVALRFSQPIVHFDTVFTTVGSITRHFTVHNPSNSTIKTNIFLAGDNQTYYSINVNGVSGIFFKDVEIPKKDSIFIFVKVNINPGMQNNPFLVTDSIVFLTGSRKQDVKLLAYGQDANFIVADRTTGFKVVAGEHETVRWTKEKPYVVHGWAAIDSTGTLIIEPGTKIYFHNNSGLWAYRYSNLEVNGTLDEPVLFRGDRLESWFDNDFAQWSRIWINEGAQVNINHAIITNAFVGVQVEPLPYNDGTIIVTSDVTVKINNTIIRNTKNCGVLSRLLNIDMTNCVIANNGARSLQLEGGTYNMKHLTIANYFNQVERKVPACYVSNKIAIYNDCYETKANFINCIIFGNNETEVEVNKVQAPNADLNVVFENCLVRAKDNATYFMNCLRNEDPEFIDIKKLDFKLQASSPAIGRGKPDIGVFEDILGNSRGSLPDIGAYQFGR